MNNNSNHLEQVIANQNLYAPDPIEEPTSEDMDHFHAMIEAEPDFDQ